MYLLVEHSAQLLVLHHNEEGTGGNGQKAWQEIKLKPLQVVNEGVRAKLAELAPTSTKAGQDQDGSHRQEQCGDGDGKTNVRPTLP